MNEFLIEYSLCWFVILMALGCIYPLINVTLNILINGAEIKFENGGWNEKVKNRI
jgi:hypothetical protein